VLVGVGAADDVLDTLLLLPVTVEEGVVVVVWLKTSVRVPVGAVVATVTVVVGEKYVAPEGIISPSSETELLSVRTTDLLLNGALRVTTTVPEELDAAWGRPLAVPRRAPPTRKSWVNRMAADVGCVYIAKQPTRRSFEKRLESDQQASFSTPPFPLFFFSSLSRARRAAEGPKKP
jgi:hypothetical protein